MLFIVTAWKTFISSRFAPVVTTLIVFSTGAAVSWHYTQNYYLAKIANTEKAQAKREAMIAAEVLGAQQAQLNQMQGALDAAQKQTVQAQRDADSARVAAGKLRGALADYRARYPAGTASPGQGEPSGDPIGVLVDVLGRMGEAGERVSRYADEVKIAGLACEKLATNEEN